MNDNEIDDIVNKTIVLIEKDYNDSLEMYPFFYIIEVIDKYFLNKKEYMKLLIKGGITNIQRKIHDLIEEYQLKENKKFMIRLIWLDGNALQYASEELRNNKEVVLTAVKKDGNALQYASEELQNDKDVVFQSQKTEIMKEIEIGRNKR